MKILFANGNGYPPQENGGMENSTAALIARCIANGNDAALTCQLYGGGAFGLGAKFQMKLFRRKFAIDRRMGHLTMRSWDVAGSAKDVVSYFQPDIVLAQGNGSVAIARAMEAQGVATVLYFRHMEYELLGGNPGSLRNTSFIANSNYTSDFYQKISGVRSVVIPPMIEVEKYATDGPKDMITFINPNIEKGYETALAIATACPEVPFQFVESWSLPDERVDLINRDIAGLQNVTLVRRSNDMRDIYARTKILLAPSQWEEAWGRVASEAHCSGIPVIGSDCGGLGEAIGPGGVVISRDAPIEDWVRSVKLIWRDVNVYEQLSARALEYARREALNPAYQYGQLMEVVAAKKVACQAE